MENIKQIRKQVKRYIDIADDTTVKMMYAMLEVQQENDWWDDLPQKVQNEIDESLKDLDSGNGTSDQEVKKMYPQWFKK